MKIMRNVYFKIYKIISGKIFKAIDMINYQP